MDVFSKLKEMKILLIDDDEWIRDSLTMFFKGEGCSCTAVETAEEGLKAFEKQIYDIVIVDYRLPGMDGLEFFNRILEPRPHAMKILITAYGNAGVFSEAKRMGVQDIIEKPLTPEAIELSLSRLIENRM